MSTRSLVPVLVLLALGCSRRADQVRPVSPAPAPVAQATVDPELNERLVAIDRIVERKRVELDVPGVALVIVDHGKTIHTRGFGYRDVEKNLPVTPDTVFAIGSTTKAFTALSTLIAVDHGKISLDDSPKKCLPYFSMLDPETDKNIVVRDLLLHSSGLGRTDASWAYGDLTREDAIKIAGQAKPLVKLREAFNYQNTMYAAVGECAGRVMGTSWEELVHTRILAPLGMNRTSLTLAAFQDTENHSMGYEVSYADNGAPEGVIPAWQTGVHAIAPAGSINSSVNDMAKWLTWLQNDGRTPKLVSEARFADFLKPQIEVSTETQYAMGWFVDKWRGNKKLSHGGSLPGFSAMVSMLPDKHIGYVMVTNVSGAPAFGLAETVMDAVYSLALPKKAADIHLANIDPGDPKQTEGTEVVPPDKEIGTYELRADAEHTLLAAVTQKNGRLVLIIPGESEYELEPVRGRKYKFLPPEAPRDFFVTFRKNATSPVGADAYVEQPNGKVVLRKIDNDPKRGLEATSVPPQNTSTLKELFGVYEAPKMVMGAAVRIQNKDGHVVLDGFGSPRGLALVSGKTPDQYTLHGVPGFVLTVKRNDRGSVAGFTIDVQGRQTIEFARTRDLDEELPVPKLSVDQLMAKQAKAHGAKSLAKLKSIVVHARTTREYEGMAVDVTITRKAPNLLAIRESYIALGKTILQTGQIYDGSAAYAELGRREPRKLRGRATNNVAVDASFNPLLDWKTTFEHVEIKRMTKLDGELTYVVEKRAKNANVITEYISAKTFLTVRRDSRPLGSSAVEEQRFSNYKRIRGVMLPFKIEAGAGATRAVTEVTKVDVDVDVPDSEFRPSRPVSEPKAISVAG